MSITGESDYKHALAFTSDSTKDGDYVLQIVNQFGKFTGGNPPTITENSFVKRWYDEYQEVAQTSETQMTTAYDKFDELLGIKDNAIDGLEQGKTSINDIKSSFDSVKDQISGAIIDYSDIIDDYGKLSFKIVFSILMILDAGIAVFISLLFFCSFRVNSFGCLKCLFKTFIIIFWNILALLTFFTLFIGFIFTLIGTVGKDLISVVEFLVSDNNLDKGENAILLGGASTYLIKCINKDGNLKNELNLDLDSMNKIDDLKAASIRINNIADQTKGLFNTKFAYKAYKANFDSIKNYQTDNFYIAKFHNDDYNSFLNFKDYLLQLNQNVANDNEEWSISCTNNEHSCDVTGSHTEQFCINIKSCSTKKVGDWYDPDNDNVKVLDAFIDSIKLARISNVNTETMTGLPETKSIENVLAILDSKYTAFLTTQTDSLTVFNRTINGLTGIFTEFAGDNDLYSILNCKFIGRNVKIILKYLDKSLGKNIYTVGICFLISGISMCFSISLTILLNIIVNIKGQKKVEMILMLKLKR